MESVAEQVRIVVDERPFGSFVEAAKLIAQMSANAHAINCALSRMAASGELLPVRKGLYWKGKHTRYGVQSPRPYEVAMHLAGPGSGPAGFTAASSLGLTTQVPATIEIAVPGRPPVAPQWVRFASRSPLRRENRLSPDEVALLEVLSDWPSTVESDWGSLIARVGELIKSERISPLRIDQQVREEHRPATRDGWGRLREALSLAA